MNQAKNLLASALRTCTRAYVRYAPWRCGKRVLYTRFIAPSIAWRPGTAVARTRFGARHHVKFPDLIQSRLYYFGIWEPAVTQVFIDSLRSGDVVIDVGANVGYYTLLSSRLVGPTGAVWALEASSQIYSMLQDALRFNGAKNVTARRVAVHRERTTVKLWMPAADNLGRSTIMGDDDMLCESETVDALPLPEIVPLQILLSAKLIKIDVEGAEMLVFEGVRAYLPQFARHTRWVMEIAPQRLGNRQPQEVFGAFQDAGYSAYRVPNSYCDETYLAAPPRSSSSLERLNSAPAQQADILFVRE